MMMAKRPASLETDWPGAKRPSPELRWLRPPVRTNVWGRGSVHSPSRSRTRTLLGVRLGVLRAEVRERFLGLLCRENPGRTLRLDRTRERSAQVRANDLTANAKRVRELLRSIGLVGHVVTSLRSFVESIVAHVRTIACKDFVNVRANVRSSNMCSIPPCHPPRGRNCAWRANLWRTCEGSPAKSAGKSPHRRMLCLSE